MSGNRDYADSGKGTDQWEAVTWGDVATLEYGKGLRGYDQPSGKFRVFGTNGPIGWTDTALSDSATVVLGRKGAYRGVHYSPNPCYVIDTAFYLKPKITIDIRWAYYAMLTLDINSMDSGSAIPSTSREDFYRLPLLLPSLQEQQEIASTLGALDDKIELNRRMSQTLEEIARTLFKSWFVDFDPVHAKAAGRQPAGMDAETAALFPSEFEDSELGLIPQGWRVSTIGEEVKVLGGSTPSTSVSEFWEGGTNAWATPKDLAALQVPLLTSTERQITDSGVQQISSRQLPPGTLLLSSRAPVGYLAISQIPISINQGFIAMICDGIISSTHALWWAEANLEEIRGRANGTTFQEISKSNFRPIPLVVPPPEVATRFSSQTKPLIDRMAELIEESLTLKNLRDTLLPRLLSGEMQFS